MKTNKKRIIAIVTIATLLLVTTLATIYAVSNSTQDKNNTVVETPVVEQPVTTPEPSIVEVTPEPTTVEPIVTEPPVVEEKPVETIEPEVTEAPVETTKPVATESPVETAKPVAEKPVTTEKPVVTEQPATPTPQPTEAPATEAPAENTSGYLTVGEMSKYVIQSYLTNDTSTDYLHYAKLMISEGYFAREDSAKYDDTNDMSRLVTRAELARVLTVYYILYYGQDYLPENVVNTFTDLSKSDEVTYFYCNAAVHYNLMTTPSKDKFNPMGNITKDDLFYGLTK